MIQEQILSRNPHPCIKYNTSMKETNSRKHGKCLEHSCYTIGSLLTFVVCFVLVNPFLELGRRHVLIHIVYVCFGAGRPWDFCACDGFYRFLNAIACWFVGVCLCPLIYVRRGWSGGTLQYFTQRSNTYLYPQLHRQLKCLETVYFINILLFY